MTGWIDPDNAPEWEDDVFDRAEVRLGDKVVRPASGTLTREGDREGNGREGVGKIIPDGNGGGAVT